MTKEKKLFIVIVSVYLASQQFFNPLGAISQQLGKFLFYAFTLIALIIALNKKNVSNNYPKKAYSLIIIGILFSIFMGGTFHEQSINICIIASLPYLLSYLFLYILFKVNISNYKIEKLLKTMVICSAIIYISNLIVFPNKIFGVEKDEYDMSRGFARIGVPMIEIVVVYFFYSINQWILSKNKKSIFYIILCLLLIFMSLTRQIIIFSIIAGVWFILIKASKTKKMITLSVIIVCFIFIIPKLEIYQTIINLTNNQIESNKDNEDIRITAWKFYTYKNQTNNLTYFLGNGVPSAGNSIWGNAYEKQTSPITGNACFAVDVGWAGFYWYFGLLSVIGLLSLLLKCIIKRKTPNNQYLTYSCLFFLITSITSGPILNYNQIMCLCFIVYMIYSNQLSKSIYLKDLNSK